MKLLPHRNVGGAIGQDRTAFNQMADRKDATRCDTISERPSVRRKRSLTVVRGRQADLPLSAPTFSRLRRLE